MKKNTGAKMEEKTLKIVNKKEMSNAGYPSLLY